MADEDQTVPWDASTDVFINDIGTDVDEKYKISFRKLLLNPTTFDDVADMSDTVEKIRVDVVAYFDDLFSDLKDDDAQLTTQMETLDALHTQINQTISSRSGIARTPLLKPAGFDPGNAAFETVFVDKYDGQLDLLITKLINGSNYICDLSTSYRKYSLGNWFFSGSKNCVIAVQVPESRVIAVESAKNTVMAYLDNASALF